MDRLRRSKNPAAIAHLAVDTDDLKDAKGAARRAKTGIVRPRERLETMIATTQGPLILFDGVCNLCNAWVRFVVRRDPAGIFHFAEQQSPTGQAIVEEHLSGGSQLSSVILIEDNAIYTDSDAVLQILARLTPPWSWIALLQIIPRLARDACYRFIVRHRYQWFGRTEACQIPSEDVRSRFVE